MKVQRHESLGIYIYTKPRNKREQEYNERMTEKAEAIRCRRYESIVNERYDFFDKEKQKGDFVAYFKRKAEEKNEKWLHVFKHFNLFCNGKCTFGEITVELCNKFKDYLFDAPQMLHKDRKLYINTIAGYWSTFRAVIHTAYRDHKIQENPNGFLEKIEDIPTDKEHLSQQEVVRLNETECPEPILKKAFLFSVLTGLRKSDIKNLTWEKIQPYGDGGMYVSVRMQKTKQIINNPISNEALDLIGFYDDEEREPTEKVFPNFKDKMTQAPLKRWLRDAGITKHITFHCARHTFGSLQVDAGTGIYTVQRMLGHKNVETTQIYAAMNDESKRESVNRITLKPKTEEPTKPILRIVGE
ncbi:MAG: site-specific integrase [Bacteroidaceae bacterium]|nr:site-specific integrase [Bacteroidaceae bacterium]MCF0245152.1 site-specific integrase [Bacteroidaceae bacterium]